MTLLKPKKPRRTTSFTAFITTAPSSEKKRVYRHVLDEASERQQAVVDLARERAAAREVSK
jgi:hypothetical protein